MRQPLPLLPPANSLVPQQPLVPTAPQHHHPTLVPQPQAHCPASLVTAMVSCTPRPMIFAALLSEVHLQAIRWQ